MADKNVTVKLSANVDAYRRGMKEAEKSTDGLANSTDKATSSVGSKWSATGSKISGAMGLSYAAVGAGAVMLAKTSIDAASNLEESINAVNVSYGDSADAVHKLGDASVESFGLSQRAFNEAAVSFTSFAEDVAGDGGDVAATLEQLMLRSTDFASVMNMDVTEAANAFKSALSGEAEPLKAFGINISDAATKAYALRTGLIDVGEVMTDQQKVQARYGLLMQETSKTAGDFANTSDGYANAMKKFKAEAENLSAALGSKLMPMLADLTSNLTEVLSVVEAIGAIDIAAGFMKWANPVTHIGNVASTARGETDLLGREYRTTTQAAWDYAEAQEALGRSFDEALHEYEAIEAAVAANGSSYEQVTGAIDAAVAARQAEHEAIETATSSYSLVTGAIGAAIDAHNEETEAINRVSDARRQGTDYIYDALEAEDRWWATLDATNAVLADTEASEREKAAATRDMATATDEVVTAQLVANGVDMATVTGKQKWLESMLAVADGLSGPVRDEVLNYISLMSGIPAEKLTNIRPETDFARLAEIEADLNFTARQRFVRFSPTGGMNAFASGTLSAPGGPALVGELGPEIVDLPKGSRVYPAGQTASMLRAVPTGGYQTVQPRQETLIQHIYQVSATGVGLSEVAPWAAAEISRKQRLYN